MGNVEVRSGALLELVDPAAALQQVGTGFVFTEGPVWHPHEHYLLFSDIVGDVRRKYVPGAGIVETRRPTGKANGMTYDADLNLLVCEHATSRLVRERPNGTRRVIASHFEGSELNSPNDVCVRSDGSIYFTDPGFGRQPGFGLERKPDLGWQGVYRVPPGGGDPELLVDRHAYEQPNGLCFSPDESLLYVDDTPNALIDVYEVEADGTLANRRRFAEEVGSAAGEGLLDGMKCDERGNLWVSGPGGVWVFTPRGEHLGTILVPEIVGNLAWGGEDWHTLFVTASTSLYAIPTAVGPRREPYMG